MTKGYITVQDIVYFNKNHVKNKTGFTESLTECQIFDATLEDGRYVVSIDKIADIRTHPDKNIILWHRPKQAELYNVYVGGWYNEQTKIYEIEEVTFSNDIESALKIAQYNNQSFIFDMQDGKVINVRTYYLVKRLEAEKDEINKTLEALQIAWSLEKDGQIADALAKAYDYVMLTRKQIGKRIVLLERQE